MGSDSSEPTRRKHHRSSSTDDAEERSKRRKHRHRHRHHHHRHRSSKDKEETSAVAIEELEGEKIDEIQVEERLEKIRDKDDGASGEVLVSGGQDSQGWIMKWRKGRSWRMMAWLILVRILISLRRICIQMSNLGKLRRMDTMILTCSYICLSIVYCALLSDRICA
ncbi:UNVERIFIED_CONTAM: hypothetical protein Slati_0248000 [Sesamum latifolium]|uniref:Uncharacterized protein n=1 Tax=Sesamum latifolium TaxID=2727402 RepID=A0AAW2YD81_9LAMI